MRIHFLDSRYLLTRLGRFVSAKFMHTANSALNYVEVGRWMHANHFVCGKRFKRREDLFEAMARTIEDKVVLYLEFGVFEGKSLRFWSNRLRNSESRLHGFDSFEGLPEHWNLRNPAGKFSTSGALPQIADSRVELFKGWFQETLPGYVLPRHEQLVINMDADLYGSTIYVLNRLKDHIRPGTLIYFDEFSDRDHELKAFDEFLNGEFLNENKLQFELVGATHSLSNVAFRCK